MKRSASKTVSTCRVASRRQNSSRYSSIPTGIAGLDLMGVDTGELYLRDSGLGTPRRDALVSAPERVRMTILNVEHVACNVSEPNAMAAWYVEHLGMTIVRRLQTAPHTHFLADAKGHVVI